MNRADLIDWTLFYGVGTLPAALCSEVGARLSPLLGRKPHPDQHRNAMALFGKLRPDLARDEAACSAAVDRLWANIGRTFAEFAVSHRMLRAGRVGIANRERLDAALDSGRPIVAIFPHLGNWELSEMQFGFLAPHRGAVIVAPPSSDARATIAQKVRSKAPAELLPMSPTVWRQAIARLKTPGGGIMLAIDEQVAGRVMAPSFGRPLETEGNLGKAARLALMTGALVVPFYNERLPGARFLTHFLPTITPAGKASDPGAVRAAIAEMEAAMQDPIIRLLDQWYMALFATAP